MTDDERLALAERAWMENRHDERAYLLAFARALESRVLAERRPVAWRYDTDYGVIYLSMQCDHTYADANGEYIKGTPLYLAAPERKE
jgi:hypothetical protein